MKEGSNIVPTGSWASNQTVYGKLHPILGLNDAKFADGVTDKRANLSQGSACGIRRRKLLPLDHKNAACSFF